MKSLTSARDLNAARRQTAEEEARLRDSNVSLWTAERLRVSLSNKLQNKALFVIANSRALHACPRQTTTARWR